MIVWSFWRRFWRWRRSSRKCQIVRDENELFEAKLGLIGMVCYVRL
jgi:hypothetical protein